MRKDRLSLKAALLTIIEFSVKINFSHTNYTFTMKGPFVL
jgi:hypothetical protein